MPSRSKRGLSADDIRGSYFGPRQRQVEESALSSPPVSDLTPSARYIIREAKKSLGQQNAFGETAVPDEEDLLRLVRHLEQNEDEELSEKERAGVLAALSASLDHYDILTPLVENPQINDIIVRSYHDISVQSHRRNIQTDLAFADQETYKSFVENLLKRAGKSCSLANPVTDAAIDPNVRACVTHQSFSPPGCGPMLTLRIARHRNISLEGLVSHELAPRAILEYLAALAAHARATLLIAGEVGTGKTTLLKALATRIDAQEAILIIEDTHELLLDRRFVRTLLTREANAEGTGRISPAMAIRTGMRMAMNRLILGEMRDAEAAEAFIDVCSSGHAGMSTIHARSGRDALARLELFLSRAQGNVGIETIHRQIANAVSAVIFLGMDRYEHKRRVLEVMEIGPFSDGAIQVSPMFAYDTQSRFPQWKRLGGMSFYDAILAEHGMALAANESLLTLDPEQMYRSYQT